MRNIPRMMVFLVPNLLIETATRGIINPLRSILMVWAMDAVPLFQSIALIMAGKIAENP
jgi:hypothetical protein